MMYWSMTITTLLDSVLTVPQTLALITFFCSLMVVRFFTTLCVCVVNPISGLGRRLHRNHQGEQAVWAVLPWAEDRSWRRVWGVYGGYERAAACHHPHHWLQKVTFQVHVVRMLYSIFLTISMKDSDFPGHVFCRAVTNQFLRWILYVDFLTIKNISKY